jgi:hypothetical protein
MNDGLKLPASTGVVEHEASEGFPIE